MSDSGKESITDNNDNITKDVNTRIYTSLLKRDSKEKHVTVCKLIEANDKLVRLVTTLKLELDEQQNKLSNSLRRIAELEVLLKEKDAIILQIQSTSATPSIDRCNDRKKNSNKNL